MVDISLTPCLCDFEAGWSPGLPLHAWELKTTLASLLCLYFRRNCGSLCLMLWKARPVRLVSRWIAQLVVSYGPEGEQAGWELAAFLDQLDDGTQIGMMSTSPNMAPSAQAIVFMLDTLKPGWPHVTPVTSLVFARHITNAMRCYVSCSIFDTIITKSCGMSS